MADTNTLDSNSLAAQEPVTDFSIDWASITWTDFLTGAGVALALILGAIIANKITSKLILPLIRLSIDRTKTEWDDVLLDDKLINKLSWLAGAGVLLYAPQLCQAYLHVIALRVFEVASQSLMILSIMLAIGAFADGINGIYSRHAIARTRPIKGYLQIGKMIVYIAGLVLLVATVLDKDPVVLFTGLGAMTAILLLIFKDTILSLVASIQLSSNDMLRVGDWLEMPSVGADGDVIDIALHTVKVQNWDKTISTIPTHKLITSSFKNWRGMSESGGRRIKRSLHLDMSSIHFLTDEQIEQFSKLELLHDYFAKKKEELGKDNKPAADGLVANHRRLTNIGTLRAYIIAYLHAKPEIHDSQMTFLVRQLAPGATGLPIELYIFTRTVNWIEYEAIQADIFDHILAMIGEFDLRIFQNPTGADFGSWAPEQTASS